MCVCVGGGQVWTGSTMASGERGGGKVIKGGGRLCEG